MSRTAEATETEVVGHYFRLSEPPHPHELPDPYTSLFTEYQLAFDEIVASHEAVDAAHALANEEFRIHNPLLVWVSTDFSGGSISIPSDLAPFLGEAFRAITYPVLEETILGRNGATLVVRHPIQDANRHPRRVHIDFQSQRYSIRDEDTEVFSNVPPATWSDNLAPGFTFRFTQEHMAGIFELQGVLLNIPSHKTIPGLPSYKTVSRPSHAAS